MPKAVKYKEEDLPPPGSVFLVPLEDGRFGAVRVLRTKSEGRYACAFVVPSRWIGTSAVRPSDDAIRLPLLLTHHQWANKRDAAWVCTPPPASFIPVGSIEIKAADSLIAEEVYQGWDGFPLQILLQWRWDNDREAVLAGDVAEKAKQAEARRLADERRAELLRTVT